jgi:hypothetical protein
VAAPSLSQDFSSIEKDPNRPANWKDDREFYSQCASHFRVVKDAWRNYTAHAPGKYDEQEDKTMAISSLKIALGCAFPGAASLEMTADAGSDVASRSLPVS